MRWIALLVLAAPVWAGDSAVEESGLRQLLTIRRVYVDHLTGGETAAEMRDILISSLEGSKLFILTENVDRADVIMRGASEDLVFTETHSSSSGLNAHADSGTRSAGYLPRRLRRGFGGRERVGPLYRAPSRSHRRRPPGE